MKHTHKLMPLLPQLFAQIRFETVVNVKKLVVKVADGIRGHGFEFWRLGWYVQRPACGGAIGCTAHYTYGGAW
jgi:hypothetical protein